VLRAYYLLLVVGTGAVFWPSLISHSPTWALDNGAQYALLAAFTPFALLGLRYPLEMLPIVFFEFTWKALWFIFVFWPLWLGGDLTPLMWSNAFACAIAIVLTPIVVPWRYLVNALSLKAKAAAAQIIE
jgi:hypothetical protein